LGRAIGIEEDDELQFVRSPTADLRRQILDFIDYFNQLLAKPFRWTYAGKPLTA